MHAFRSLRSKTAMPLTLAAAGLWASSTRFERRTVAEPATTSPPDSQQRSQQLKARHGEEDRTRSAASPDQDKGNKKPVFPPPIGPMVAVFLDKPSVETLKAHFPEARNEQLRRVVVQYGTSVSEREMYRHLFSKEAVVTVTGDASSFARRALVASVSHAGRPVEPSSLSAAIDISPPVIVEPGAPAVAEEDGPGHLASAVLIEQIKETGAIEEDMWEGKLPPMSAYNRQFPSESGAYVRLKEPITVRGTICRADWVDGASISCRNTLDGGEARPEDWEPSDCSICSFFSVSPCNGIFNRFVETSKRRDEYLKTFEPEEEDSDEEEGVYHKGKAEADGGREGHAAEATSGTGVATVGGVQSPRDEPAGENKEGGGARGDAHSPENGRGEPSPLIGKAAQRRGAGQGGRDLIEQQLDKEATAIFNEMKECMTFHDMY